MDDPLGEENDKNNNHNKNDNNQAPDSSSESLNLNVQQVDNSPPDSTSATVADECSAISSELESSSTPCTTTTESGTVPQALPVEPSSSSAAATTSSSSTLSPSASVSTLSTTAPLITTTTTTTTTPIPATEIASSSPSSSSLSSSTTATTTTLSSISQINEDVTSNTSSSQLPTESLPTISGNSLVSLSTADIEQTTTMPSNEQIFPPSTNIVVEQSSSIDDNGSTTEVAVVDSFSHPITNNDVLEEVYQQSDNNNTDNNSAPNDPNVDSNIDIRLSSNGPEDSHQETATSAMDVDIPTIQESKIDNTNEMSTTTATPVLQSSSSNNNNNDDKDDNKSDHCSQSSSVQSSVPTEIINESSQGTIEDETSLQEGIGDLNLKNDSKNIENIEKEIDNSVVDQQSQPSNAFSSINNDDTVVAQAPDSSAEQHPETLSTVQNEIQQSVPESMDSLSADECLPSGQDIEMTEFEIPKTEQEFEALPNQEPVSNDDVGMSSANDPIKESELPVSMKPTPQETVDIQPDIFKSIKFAICEDIPDIDEIKRVLLAGGAKFLNYLSDSATLLIADNAEHSSVIEAVDIYEKPVVTSQWVWLSLRAKTVLPTTPFSILNDRAFLTSICASSSQLSRTDRARVWALITYYGGKYQATLDQNCTHLITNSITGRKYDKATAPGSTCKTVTIEWLQECCKTKQICSEEPYHPRLLLTYNSDHTRTVAADTKNKTNANEGSDNLGEEDEFTDAATTSSTPTIKAVKMSISTEACVRQKDAKIVPVKIAKPSIVELKVGPNAGEPSTGPGTPASQQQQQRTKAPLNVQTTPHNVPTPQYSAAGGHSPRNAPGLSPRRYPQQHPGQQSQQQNFVSQQHQQSSGVHSQNVQAPNQQVQSQQSELDPNKHFARKSQPQYSQQQQQQPPQQQQIFPGQHQNSSSMMSPTNTSQKMQHQQHPQQMQQMPQQTHPSQQQHIQMPGRPIPQGANQAQLIQQRQQIQLQQRGIPMGGNIQSQQQQQQISPQIQQNPHQIQQMQQQNPQAIVSQPQVTQPQQFQQNPQQQHQQFQQNGPVQQRQIYVSLGAGGAQQEYQAGQQFVVQRPMVAQQNAAQNQMQNPTNPQMIAQQAVQHPQQQQQQQIYRYQNQQQALQAQQQQRFQQNVGMQSQQSIQQQQQQHMAMNSNVRMQQQQRFPVRPPMQQMMQQSAQQQQVSPQQSQQQQQMGISQQNQANYQLRPKLVILPNNESDGFVGQGPQQAQQTGQGAGGYPMNVIHIPANIKPEQRQQYIAQHRMQIQQQQAQQQQQSQMQHPQQHPQQQSPAQIVQQSSAQMSIQQQSQPISTNTGTFVQNPQMQIQVRQSVPVQQQQQQVILQQQQQQRMMRPPIPQQGQPGQPPVPGQQHYQMNQIRPQQIVRQMHPQQQQMQYQQQQQRQWQGQEFQPGQGPSPSQQQQQQTQSQQPGISVHYNMQQQSQMRTQGQDGQWVQSPVHPQQQRIISGPNGPIPQTQVQAQQQQPQQQQQPPSHQVQQQQQHNQQVTNVYQQQQQQQPKMVSSVHLIGPESGTKIKLEPAPPPPVATVVAGENRNLIVMQQQPQQQQTQQVQQQNQAGLEQPTLVQVQVQQTPSSNILPVTTPGSTVLPTNSQVSQIPAQNANIVHEKTKTALANLLNNRLQNNTTTTATTNGSPVLQTPGTPTGPPPTATVVQVSQPGIPGVSQTQGKLIQLPVQAFQVQQQQQQQQQKVPPLISQASVQNPQQSPQQQASLTPQNQIVVQSSATQIQVQHLGSQPQQQQQQQQITLLNANASIPSSAQTVPGSFPHKPEHAGDHPSQIPMHQRNGYIQAHGGMQPPPPYSGQNGVILQQTPQHIQQNAHHPQQPMHQGSAQQIPGQKVLHPQMVQQQQQQQQPQSQQQQQQPLQHHPNAIQQAPQQHLQPSPMHPHMSGQHPGFQHQVQLQQPQHLQQPLTPHQVVPIPKPPRQQFVQIRYFGQETKQEVVPSRLCLFGSVFFFGPFYVEKESASKMIPFWRKAIEKYGGKVVDDYSSNVKIITHFLTDNMQSMMANTALKDGKRCVSIWWIEDVLNRQHLIPPWRFYHLPMMNVLSLKNQIITTTNFEKNDREKLRMLILKAGGIYTPYITRQNTVLIAASLRGRKYELALNYRLPIVNMKWLHDAMLGIAETLQLSNLGKRYLTFDSLSAESTNSSTNNGTTKSLANDIFGVDYSVVHNLMNSWKVAISYNEDELKKKHREILEEEKKEKARLEEEEKLKKEKEAAAATAEAEKLPEEKKTEDIPEVVSEVNKDKEPEAKDEPTVEALPKDEPSVEVASKDTPPVEDESKAKQPVEVTPKARSPVEAAFKQISNVQAGAKRDLSQVENVKFPTEGEPSTKKIKLESGDSIESVSITNRSQPETRTKDVYMSNVNSVGPNDADSQGTTTIDSAVSEFKVPLPPVICVLVTGIPVEESDKLCEAIKKLGGKWTKSPEDCTHLVANGLEGTVKFLCAFGRAKHVLKPKWILDSLDAGKLLPEDDYNLLSKDTTEKYGIDFTGIERTPSLFKDTVFVLTPSVPNAKNIQTILTANGCSVSLREMPNRRQLEALLKKDTKFVIVSCKTDLHLCRTLVTNQYRDFDIPVISSEYIYRAIYMQSYDFKKNNLLSSNPETPANGPTNNPSSSNSMSSLQNQSLLARLQTNSLPSRPASATAILQRTFSGSSATVSPLTITGLQQQQHQTLNSVNTIPANISHVKPIAQHSNISTFQVQAQVQVQQQQQQQQQAQQAPLQQQQHHHQQNISSIQSNTSVQSAVLSGQIAQPTSGNTPTATAVLVSTQNSAGGPVNKTPNMIVAHSNTQAGSRLLVLPS